jgi:hypothetical protein
LGHTICRIEPLLSTRPEALRLDGLVVRHFGALDGIGDPAGRGVGVGMTASRAGCRDRAASVMPKMPALSRSSSGSTPSAMLLRYRV